MNERDDETIRAYQAWVEQINARESGMRNKMDDALRSVTDRLEVRVQPITEEAPLPAEDRNSILFPSRFSRKKDASDDRQR